LKKFPEKQRVFLDESGLCYKLARTHGYAFKGDPIHGLTYGQRKGRTNIIGAWSSENTLFATQIYDHNINKNTFIEWIKTAYYPHSKRGWW
jgi:hypothetical protein